MICIVAPNYPVIDCEMNTHNFRKMLTAVPQCKIRKRYTNKLNTLHRPKKYNKINTKIQSSHLWVCLRSTNKKIEYSKENKFQFHIFFTINRLNPACHRF